MDLTKNNYQFPEGTEVEQFQYVSDMMDDIEESVHNELVFKIDTNYNNQWMIEIYEHAEDDDDSFDSLELVDWYTGETLKDVFTFLLERYV